MYIYHIVYIVAKTMLYCVKYSKLSHCCFRSIAEDADNIVFYRTAFKTLLSPCSLQLKIRIKNLIKYSNLNLEMGMNLEYHLIPIDFRREQGLLRCYIHTVDMCHNLGSKLSKRYHRRWLCRTGIRLMLRLHLSDPSNILILFL